MARDNVSVRIEMHRNVIDAEGARIGRRAVNETARAIEREAKARVPVRTGHTRSTIKANPARVSRGTLISASVTAGGAAKYLTKGTRAHVIRARRAKALAFQWQGRQVFFRSVHHPGTKAYPFLTIAAERVAARQRGRR